MSTIDTIRDQVEIWDAFKGLPDDAVVRADLAAIFLGVSKKTLARLRQEGDGPTYIQINEEGSTARNQIVSYEMGELRAYRASKKVKSSIHAAQVRGLTFATLGDLAEEQPFVMRTVFTKRIVGLGDEVVKPHPRIIGHALTVTDGEFDSLLHGKDLEVVWLSLPDALNEDWVNGSARQPFHWAYVELLQGWIDQSHRGQETAALHEFMDSTK